jgi:hypothetical protein
VRENLQKVKKRAARGNEPCRTTQIQDPFQGVGAVDRIAQARRVVREVRSSIDPTVESIHDQSPGMARTTPIIIVNLDISRRMSQSQEQIWTA